MFTLIACKCDKSSIKLTFEVENNEQFCMFHKFDRTIEYMLKYGVLKGGNLDIDFFLESPGKKRVYSGTKTRKLDIFTFFSTHFGIYKFCFSNSFSTISHKVVFFEIKPLDPKNLDSLRKESGLTVPFVADLSEKSIENIHANLESINEIQRIHKQAKTIGANFAIDLNQKVGLISTFNFFAILMTSIIQIKFLKNLFNTK